ncbi:MAG: PEP-CTERM sorting domain-containing protein, partial [Pseudomonadota bacterium]
SRPGGAPDYVGLRPRSQAQAQVPAPGTLLLVMAGFLASSRRRLGTLLCIVVSPKVCEPKHAVGIHV